MGVKAAAGALMVSGCLLFSSAAFAEEPKEPKELKEQKVTAPAGESAGKVAPRMIVTKDPETGQLRAPTAKEIEALKATAPAPKLAVSGKATTVEKLLSGRVRATLGPEYMRYSVVRKNPDGSLSEECVQASRVDEALKTSAVASRPVPATKPGADEK